MDEDMKKKTQPAAMDGGEALEALEEIYRCDLTAFFRQDKYETIRAALTGCEKQSTVGVDLEALKRDLEFNCDMPDWDASWVIEIVKNHLASLSLIAKPEVQGDWNGALTLAHNYLTQKIDEINSEDGSCEAMNAMMEVQKKILSEMKG